MIQRIVILVVTWIAVLQSSEARDPNYCDVQCKRNGVLQDHVMCVFNRNQFARKCGRVVKYELTQSEKQYIVNEHNRLRRKVAQGQETRGLFGRSQPRASNMPDLVWDDTLATFAQRWAMQCDGGHICSDLADGYVGQNVAWRNPSVGDATSDARAFINNWYDEVQVYDPTRLSSYQKDVRYKTGHYTQIVSARTTKVGCGYVETERNGVHFVCNYSPGGNISGYPVY